MRRLALIVLSVGLPACAEPAATGSDQPGTAGPDDNAPFELSAQQVEGRAIYETMCWTCHGPSGRGDGPAVVAGSVNRPPTFHTPEFARAEPAALERRFRMGVGGTDPTHPHMQYVASILKPETFVAALSFIPALSYPPEIPGSALAGQSIYNFRCAGCHGASGRGDGTAAASLINFQPVDFTADTLIAARDWDGLYNRITEGGVSVHGSSMPPWGIVLSEDDIWDVVSYLATFQPGVLRPPYWAN